MNKTVICISGKKQSGKDSAAEYIATKVQGVEHFAFATPVKQFAYDVLGLDWCQVYGTDEQKNTLTQYCWEDMPILVWENGKSQLVCDKKGFYPACFGEYENVKGCGFASVWAIKKGKMTARQVVQYWATEILRSVDHDIFVKRCNESILRSRCRVAIITDMRFVNEVEFALANEWKILRLTRCVHQDAHRSETELDDYPLEKFLGVIDNANLSLRDKNDEIRKYLITWGLL